MKAGRKRALDAIGRKLKAEIQRHPLPPRPEIDRALKRLIERDLAERRRKPATSWGGGGEKD